jgi:hypothetical protein
VSGATASGGTGASTYARADTGVATDTGGDTGACVPHDEVPYNGIDEDCDGADLVDVDGDTWNGTRAGGDDCDDRDAAVHPDAAETCGNLVDDDCDGFTDAGCTAAPAGPPDPGGIYWICGVSSPYPAVLLALVGFALVAWRRVKGS